MAPTAAVEQVPSTTNNVTAYNANRNVCMFELGELVRNLDPPGDFASGGEATELPHHPGLKLPGYGLVPLPVTRLTANSIHEHFAPELHGRGCDTVDDPPVRECLEIDLDIATFTNPAWGYAVEELASRAAKELGVVRDVEVRPAKMILVEPGVHFDVEEHTLQGGKELDLLDEPFATDRKSVV
eukprot:TRINITY_DN2131_c0_g3_i1.p1 TRINITY_DN2131_c0_g3~~TRINITY_DN2131_c0_g3_i1.p1  ORF type:complete len:184 (-),score=31.10 TRINITY_DN2131_c0_g3_i1:45-596(-)